MIRIGIIGTENSHAMGFAKLINVSGRYPRLKVVSLYGEDPQASLKVQQECGVETIAPNPQAMLGQIDALMVTSRDGALHAKYAAPFLKAGIPAFIDKPFTRDCAEARELVSLAEASGAKIMGGSGVKFVPDVLALREFAQQNAPIGGHVWAPVSMENEYGNFYFYCAHLVESCMMIFGYDPVSVSAHRNEKGVSAVVRYPSFDVHLSFLDNIYHYGASVHGRHEQRNQHRRFHRAAAPALCRHAGKRNSAAAVSRADQPCGSNGRHPQILLRASGAVALIPAY